MTTPETISLVRRGMLALLAFGCVGALTELVLLEHYEHWQQWVPLTLLVLTLVAIVGHWTVGGKSSVRALQLLAILNVIAGSVGVLLHFGENMEAEQELNPGTIGLALVRESLRGDAPALAPGTMIQFGLLALIWAYRHPALRSTPE